MLVLDKLIITDLFKTMLAALAVIVVIIVSRKFIKILAKAIEGEVSTHAILAILGLKTIVAMVSLLPAAAFIAVIMVLGRMYRDQEMSAIASAGGGVALLYRAVFMLMFPLSLFAMELSLVTAPWANATIQEMLHKDAQSAGTRSIAAGRFSEYKQGELVIYVEDIDAHKVMHKVFVQTRQKGKLGIINAETASFQDLPAGRFFVFENGERVQGEPGQLDFIIEKFAEYAVRIQLPETAVNLVLESITSQRLMETRSIVDIAEVQRRLSIPLSILVLSALAIPLAQISPRGGVYGNLFTAFLVYFSYMNLEKISRSWVVSGNLPVWSGYISAYFITLLLVVILLVRLYGREWVLMKLTGRPIS